MIFYSHVNALEGTSIRMETSIHISQAMRPRVMETDQLTMARPELLISWWQRAWLLGVDWFLCGPIMSKWMARGPTYGSSLLLLPCPTVRHVQSHPTSTRARLCGMIREPRQSWALDCRRALRDVSKRTISANEASYRRAGSRDCKKRSTSPVILALHQHPLRHPGLWDSN